VSRLEDARAGAVRRITDRRWRWRGYLIVALVLAVFCVWPKPYLARARIMPQDTASAAGTTALMTLIGGQAQNVASLLGGGRASNDLYLIIGRSDSVADRVVKSLKLVGPGGYADEAAAKRALLRKVDINLLLGGVMEIETKTWHADESRRITAAYVEAMSKELASFGEQIIVNKQRIIDRRFKTASDRVAQAETALDKFRRANNLAAPEQQLGTELSLRAGLQAQLQAKQVELKTLQEFSGPDNPALQAVQTQIEGLRRQIAQSAAPNTDNAGPNLAGSGNLTNRYLELYRDYRLAQAIYEIYARSSEQVAVDQLAAESASYVQVIDPAYIDVERHYNVWAVALLSLVVLLAVFTEIYGPMTGLFRLDAPRGANATET
jgi:hypothetical protein